MKLKPTLFSVLLSAALSFSATLPAQATVINFEDVGFVPCTDAPILTKGFTFTASDFFHCVTPAGLPTPGANNGTSFLIEGSSFVSVTNDLALPFSLQRVDLGTSFFNATSPNLMIVRGLREDNSWISRTLVVTDEFTRFDIAGFDGLVELTFSGLLLPDPDGGQGYFALDNLVVQVPLPGSLPLAALGLGALALARRCVQPRAAGRANIA